VHGTVAFADDLSFKRTSFIWSVQLQPYVIPLTRCRNCRESSVLVAGCLGLEGFHLHVAGEKATMQQLAEVVNGGSAALSPAGMTSGDVNSGSFV